MNDTSLTSTAAASTEIAALPNAAEQLLRVCSDLGVKYLFANLGSDHPAFIDAFARLSADGVRMPQVIICPHEMTTLSAAHGFAMVTRDPQLVLVHVDVGTQNLGASVHNAARGRVPVIVVAGLSPVSTHASTAGHRNEYIHYTQDALRQTAIVEQYMKWCYELRDAQMSDQVVHRAHQIATSMPQGPVYLTAAREVWEARTPLSGERADRWPATRFSGLSAADVSELSGALAASRRPLVITSYLGYQPAAVGQLVALSERFGIAVCEVGPHYLNFPGDHPHHLGYRRGALIDEADLILLIDVDVPWLESKVTPHPDALVFHIDIDPLKQDLGFWHFPVHRSHQADSLQVLGQLLAYTNAAAAAGHAERMAWVADARCRTLPPASTPPAQGPLTPAELMHALRELIHERSVVVVESPSSSAVIPAVLKMTRPGSYFGNHGAGLGWGINAAMGVKLADPGAEVIALVGDGCFLFGVPSSAYWVSGAYRVPFLTLVLNNGGWHSPRLSTQQVHPKGLAEQRDTYWVAAGAGADPGAIAQATGGAIGMRIDEREQLRPTLARALQTVRDGRSVVVDVRMAPVTKQVLSRGC